MRDGTGFLRGGQRQVRADVAFIVGGRGGKVGVAAVLCGTGDLPYRVFNTTRRPAVSAIATLEPLLETLSEERLQQLVDFARFLAVEDERQGWERFGQSQLARAYGPDEPEYTVDDIKPNDPS
jgi:hypothetical protein